MKGSKLPIRNTKRGKKPYMLDCRYIGGVREFYSTKEEAEEVRGKKLATIKGYGTTAITISHPEVVALVRFQEELKAIGFTPETAIDFLKKHRAITEPPLLSDAISQFLDVKNATNKDDGYRRILKLNLNSLLAHTRDKAITLITRDEIEKWLYKNHWSAGTIRNKRIDVRTFFNFAVRRHWIATSPAAHLESVSTGDQPIGILQVDEAKALLESALAGRKRFLPYLVMALLCGIRPEETVKLTKENIRISEGYIEVPAYRGKVAVAKTRRRRLVDLSESAKKWLLKCDPISPKSERWYHNQVTTIKRHASIRLAELRNVEKIEFPWPKNCLRHSFASYHLSMHGSADKTAMQMGHDNTRTLFAHYRAIVTKAEAEKFWAILP